MHRDHKFWLLFLAITISMFLAALELTAVSTALPTIAAALNGEDFVWIGSAYTLCSTAFVPFSGGLAQVFGRKLVMLGSLLIFAVGSVVCGSAKTMNALIGGRAVQGLGGGGILALTQIIVSDIVPLHERGMFNGLIGMAWAVASTVGPVTGGALSSNGQWRWIFYLNIPITGLAATLVVLFLKLKTPEGTFKEKISRLDWIGNILVIAATASIVVSLSWAGIQHPWSSTQVLVPLILGLLGLAGFLLYEAVVAKHSIVPFGILNNRTAVSGYLQTFFLYIAVIGLIYYLPVYFQACKGASPTRSGVLAFGLGLSVPPAAILGGASVTRLQKYRPQLWLGWSLLITGLGLMSTVNAGVSVAHTIGYTIIMGSAVGAVSAVGYFPVLAPLPVSENARAMAFFVCLRNFAQVWGVTIGGTVLQNQLTQNLPSAFTSQLPQGTAIAYAAIPVIGDLSEPLRSQVRVAFADGLIVFWEVLIGIVGLGLLASLAMRHHPLHTKTDEDWGMRAAGKETDAEKTSLQ
ncbi:MFS general substrate transporter [Stereum hirsutum FP-91666 SS1]|uniref:MFS general substrate transporter n=1 Tax=Stereum hirsutum (strain FP-91666) TaxID=721885 RepID=UPI000440F3C0|nr:MFS general substrate transporter [Stereum hirsutum FP-91666 SS1]EIM89050.1 MFS general substrate transporter [Stereum hirsutum FP-91666 SS1]